MSHALTLTTPALDLVHIAASIQPALKAKVTLYGGPPSDPRHHRFPTVDVTTPSNKRETLRTRIAETYRQLYPRLDATFQPFRIDTLTLLVDKESSAHAADVVPVAPPSVERFADACRHLIWAAWPDDTAADIGLGCEYRLTSHGLWSTKRGSWQARPAIHQVRSWLFDTANDRNTPNLDDNGALHALVHAAACRWFARQPAWFVGVEKIELTLTVPPPTAHERAAAISQAAALAA